MLEALRRRLLAKFDSSTRHSLFLEPQYPARDLCRPRDPRPAGGTAPVRISIVTPSLNQAPFLASTIESVVGQGYPALEYIVQDGGSTDATPAVLERYRSALHRCDRAHDGGQGDALNRGFRYATGEVLAYLNSDDILLPGALWAVSAWFTAHPEVDVVYSHRVLIDEAGLEIGRWVLPPHSDTMLQWADYVPQETLFWRRRVFERVGGRFDDTFRFALDWDLLMRFREAGASFARMPAFLGAFRLHSRQKSSTLLDTVGQQEMARLRQRCHGRSVDYPEINEAIQPYLRAQIVYDWLYRSGLLFR